MHPDYVYACLKAPYSKNTKPFKNWSLPGRLPAVDYDLGQDGTSYHDKVSENTSEKPGGATNNGRTYRNDGVDIGFSKEENSPYLGWTEAGEWLAYTVTVRESGFYAFSLRHAGKAGKIKLTADTELTLATADIPATASDTDWKNLSTGIFRLEKGTHTLRLYVEEGGFNLNYLQFDKQSGK